MADKRLVFLDLFVLALQPMSPFSLPFIVKLPDLEALKDESFLFKIKKLERNLESDMD